MKSTSRKSRFERVDIYPLTFEPEMVWGKCFEKEAVDMKIKAVWFDGDCVKCAMCVEEAAGAFNFDEEVGPQVKDGIDVAAFGEGIKQAAHVCPTQRIKYHLLPPAVTGG
ncbi:MAG: ferredoxin [Candidatus Brocadiales bacterium]